MKKNMGSTDKMVRLVVAVLIAVLYYTNVISGTVALVLGALAIVFALTSFMSFCPLYVPFGISTCKVNEESKYMQKENSLEKCAYFFQIVLSKSISFKHDGGLHSPHVKQTLLQFSSINGSLPSHADEFLFSKYQYPSPFFNL